MANKIIGGIITALLVAMFLVIGLYVYGNFETATYSNYEHTATNDDCGVISTTPTDVYTTYNPLKSGSESVVIVNTTSGATVDASPSYTVDYDTGKITISSTTATLGTDTHVYANYTYYSGEGFSTIRQIGTNTTKGFQLGSILPIVLFAGLIITGIVIGFTFL